MQTQVLISRRLRLRPWRVDDAEAAAQIFGAAEVAQWLTPAMSRVPDVAAMRSVLEAWLAEVDRLVPPLGRWAVELITDDEDAEIAWQTSVQHQGHGYATEAASTLIRWAFSAGLPEVFAVSRPGNKAGARVAERLGMEWVGQTDKYYGLALTVHRGRPGDPPPA
jgi:RimJ/RimL family protein N-acetyltransferase